jgi:hypothetical protein
MKLLTSTIALLALSPLLPAQTGGWTFADDFEAGAINYGEWTRGGRDLSGTGVVDIQSRHGSNVGHVFHSSFTETYLLRGGLPISPSTVIEFDMEARAVDPGSPGGNYYSMAGGFINVSGGQSSGTVEIIDTTSSYRQSLANNNPNHAVIIIAPNVWDHYSYTLADIYNLLPGVDPTEVTKVQIHFNSYCSWWNSRAEGEIWFDNISISDLVCTLEVEPDPPVGGSLVSFTANHFAPCGAAYLAYSTIGLGSTPVPGLGLSLDIAGARSAASPTTVSIDESAVWTLTMPPRASGHTLWLQALEMGRSTTVLQLDIL